MKVIFNIEYNTVWGERLYVVGSIPQLGEWEKALAREMLFVKNGNWQYELEVPDDVTTIEYRYFVRTETGDVVCEWNKGHAVSLSGNVGSFRIYDSWLNQPQDLPFYSSAFTQAVFAHPTLVSGKSSISSESLTIQVFAPQVDKECYVALAGNQDVLGNWMPEQALRMHPDSFPVWSITLDASKVTFPLVYKFLIGNEKDSSYFLWEEGENRHLDYPFLSHQEAALVSGLFFRYSNSMSRWRGAGTVIPVFSLRSEKSFGVGDLGDLHLLVDWVKMTGQSVIQVLPMNDTRMTQTWLDSYPYSAMSIFALHPMYIDLQKAGRLKNDERRSYYEEKQKELNANEAVDYEAVVETKIAYCKDLVEQEGLGELISDEEFCCFFEQNKSWLIPYAAYCYLRDYYNTADFSKWGQYAAFDSSLITKLCAPGSIAYPVVAFNYYLQYILDKQFREVTQYARQNGVILKGDLPIGVNRHSVEVWIEPDYFNLNGQSGAPPDDFSVYGQNWLFPTYRWDAMEKDDYSWWRKRFFKMNDYFDCFRIDHILGFFRIWEIPEDYVQGLCGHFNPALPLSVEEIERAGLHFDEKRFISPRINRRYLYDLFGENTDEVTNSFLAQSSSNHFVLKSFCDTQKKIKMLFGGKDDEKSKRIKQGLYSIANEVLFLKDSRTEGGYHPRISASESFLYEELNDGERSAFDRLYDDFYYHRHNAFWKAQALKKLIPLVDSTEMLVCGEDLGMIPATVPEVMNRLQLLSLEIERMPKAFGVEFADLSTLPYFSVCTTSTHDMSPLRSWWAEDPDKTQRYYNRILKREGEAPAACTTELAVQILTNHLCSPSLLTVIPWQDWMAIDDGLKRADIDAERINVPAQTNHYWRYRMHLTLEQLLKAEALNRKIEMLIEQSSRR